MSIYEGSQSFLTAGSSWLGLTLQDFFVRLGNSVAAVLTVQLN